MDDRTQEYINLYNQLDEYLNQILGRDDFKEGYAGYRDKLENIRNNATLSASLIIRRHFDIFKTFGHIRNEIIHRYLHKVAITEEALNDIKKYLRILQNPTKVKDLFDVDVYTCSLNDSLGAVIKKMKEKTFTHIPIYDENRFVDLLTESTIIYGIEEKIDDNGDILLENIKIKDILIENPNDRYEFIKQDTNIYEVKNKFEESIKNRKRLGALLITNLGKKEESLSGIITAWDLPKIDEVING